MAGSTDIDERPAGPRGAFLRGAAAGLPFLLVAGPFAVLFGVVATEAGLDIAAVMGLTSLVIAGASQFAALQQMTEGAPIWAVLAAGLAVNLRMAMYSAALVPHLGAAPLWQRALVAYANFDMTYAASVSEYEARPGMTLPEKMGYFAGTAAVLVPIWLGGTWVGARAGALIPEGWALDFALPITFIAVVAPMLKSAAHVAAAGMSVAVSLLLAGLPSGTGLLVAAGCAMLAGAAVETAMERRR